MTLAVNKIILMSKHCSLDVRIIYERYLRHLVSFMMKIDTGSSRAEKRRALGRITGFPALSFSDHHSLPYGRKIRLSYAL